MPTEYFGLTYHNSALAAENDSLRARVRELQAEVDRLTKKCKKEYERGYNDGYNEAREQYDGIGSSSAYEELFDD